MSRSLRSRILPNFGLTVALVGVAIILASALFGATPDRALGDHTNAGHSTPVGEDSTPVSQESDDDPTSTPIPTPIPFPTFTSTPEPPTATPTLISGNAPTVLPSAGSGSSPGDRSWLVGLLAIFAGGTIFFFSTRHLQSDV